MKENKEKKVRFNVIDAIVALVLVAVIAFVGIKFFGAEVKSNATDGDKYTMTFIFEEVPDFAQKAISDGSIVTDEGKNVYMGKIKDVETAPSIAYAADQNGNMVKSSRDGYVSVKLTVEAQAQEFEHGIIIGNVKYVVGHTMTIYAGKAKLYGRIAGIEKV